MKKNSTDIKDKIRDYWKTLQFFSADDRFPDVIYTTFLHVYNTIPQVYLESIYDEKGYFGKLEKEFNVTRILLITRFDHYNSGPIKKSTVDLYVDTENKIFIFKNRRGSILFYYSQDQKSSEILHKHLKLLKEFDKVKKKPKPKPRIHILALKGHGMNQYLAFSPFDLKPFSVSIEDNYNDDFKPKSDEIIRCLKQKDGNGIVVLHGDPGTGKTFYVKHLISILDKKILYIPPALVGQIVSPEFMKILGKHPNSILVIEDGDNILRKRDENSNSQDVSSILNLADGMLHDVLRLQIVVTFNTNLSNIDGAFLRKGRLIAEHKFGKLDIKKSQALSNDMGFDTIIKEPMLLTDIYNQDKKTFREENKNMKIGFQTEK